MNLGAKIGTAEAGIINSGYNVSLQISLLDLKKSHIIFLDTDCL